MLFNLPLSGVIVIGIILVLFLVAVIMLFSTCGQYRKLQKQIASGRAPRGGFADLMADDFARTYREYGINTNTPAIITNAIAGRLHGLLLKERFINNAVSMFVTLGLFGTFLGLAHSVSSLTELITMSGTEEWLNILNSVGGGLVSSLSGMGVAFYTSLVGVACAILFTFLKTIWNPQEQRERLSTMAELWLDHLIAPKLETDYATSDESKLMQLKAELQQHASAVEKSLNQCTSEMKRILGESTKSLGDMIEYSKEPIGAFYETVRVFNENVRDFSEFNYDLRGNIERMDVTFRDLASTVKEANRNLSKSVAGASGGEAK